MRIPPLPPQPDKLRIGGTATIKRDGGTTHVFADYVGQATYMRNPDDIRAFVTKLQSSGWPIGNLWDIAESYERGEETRVPFALDANKVINHSRAELARILARLKSGAVSRVMFRVQRGADAIPYVEVRGDVPYLGQLYVREHALAAFNAANRLKIPVKWSSFTPLLTLSDFYQRWGNREKSVRKAVQPPPAGGTYAGSPRIIVRGKKVGDRSIQIDILINVEKQYTFDDPKEVRAFVAELRRMGYRFPQADSPVIGGGGLPQSQWLDRDNSQTLLLLNRIKLMKGAQLVVRRSPRPGTLSTIRVFSPDGGSQMSALQYRTIVGLDKAVQMARRYPNVTVAIR